MTPYKNRYLHLPPLFLEVYTPQQINLCLKTVMQFPSVLPIEQRFGFISPKNAAGTAGSTWWLQLMKDHAPAHAKANTHIIDCGPHAGWALQALRMGIKILVLCKSCPQFTLIEDRARQCGCLLLAQRPPLLEISDISSVSSLSNALRTTG